MMVFTLNGLTKRPFNSDWIIAFLCVAPKSTLLVHLCQHWHIYVSANIESNKHVKIFIEFMTIVFV